MSDAQQPAASDTTAAPAATSTPTATTSAANASEPATPDAAEPVRQKREARKGAHPRQCAVASSSPATSVTACGDKHPIEVNVVTRPTIASDEVRRGEAAAGNPFADMGMGAGANHPRGAQGAPNLKGVPPQLAATLQGMPGLGGTASGSASGGGGAQAPLTVLRTKTWTERLFDLQAALVVVLAVYFARTSVFTTDPTLLSPDPIAPTASLSSTSLLHRWARLGYAAPSYSDWTSPLLSCSSRGSGSVAALPLFWLFLTLQVALQAMRIVLCSSKVLQQPASMLGMLASLVPIPTSTPTPHSWPTRRLG
ncbi:hypothetical protein ACQY0O_005510 [Thecaphora frezii]